MTSNDKQKEIEETQNLLEEKLACLDRARCRASKIRLLRELQLIRFKLECLKNQNE